MGIKDELKMDDFWKYLDEGEYRKCYTLLNNSDLPTSEISTMRVAIYFRELKYEDAYSFAFDKENECSNYVKGFAAFKHPRNMEKKKYEVFINEAIEHLESAIKNNEVLFYNRLVAQTMLIDSYFILGKSEKSFDIAKDILKEYSDIDNVSPLFDGKYQIL